MESSARQGHPFAQFFMGISLKIGLGVSVNATASAYWFRMSARQGLTNAQKMMLCAFNPGESYLLEQVTNALDFIPITHRYSLELTRMAHFEANSSKVVLHQGPAIFAR